MGIKGIDVDFSVFDKVNVIFKEYNVIVKLSKFEDG